ncbi:unnamed protein product [Closterium sp. NIES-54]
MDDAIVAKILQKLRDRKDVVSALCVCKAWRRVSRMAVRHVSTVFDPVQAHSTLFLADVSNLGFVARRDPSIIENWTAITAPGRSNSILPRGEESRLSHGLWSSPKEWSPSQVRELVRQVPNLLSVGLACRAEHLGPILNILGGDGKSRAAGSSIDEGGLKPDGGGLKSLESCALEVVSRPDVRGTGRLAEGLEAIARGCPRLTALHLQGRFVVLNELDSIGSGGGGGGGDGGDYGGNSNVSLPRIVARCFSHLTSLALPLVFLPKAFFLTKRLKRLSLSLSLPAEPILQSGSPFSHLTCLESLSLTITYHPPPHDRLSSDSVSLSPHELHVMAGLQLPTRLDAALPHSPAVLSPALFAGLAPSLTSLLFKHHAPTGSPYNEDEPSCHAGSRRHATSAVIPESLWSLTGLESLRLDTGSCCSECDCIVYCHVARMSRLTTLEVLAPLSAPPIQDTDSNGEMESEEVKVKGGDASATLPRASAAADGADGAAASPLPPPATTAGGASAVAGVSSHHASAAGATHCPFSHASSSATLPAFHPQLPHSPPSPVVTPAEVAFESPHSPLAASIPAHCAHSPPSSLLSHFSPSSLPPRTSLAALSTLQLDVAYLLLPSFGAHLPSVTRLSLHSIRFCHTRACPSALLASLSAFPSLRHLSLSLSTALHPNPAPPPICPHASSSQIGASSVATVASSPLCLCQLLHTHRHVRHRHQLRSSDQGKSAVEGGEQQKQQQQQQQKQQCALEQLCSLTISVCEEASRRSSRRNSARGDGGGSIGVGSSSSGSTSIVEQQAAEMLTLLAQEAPNLKYLSLSPPLPPSHSSHSPHSSRSSHPPCTHSSAQLAAPPSLSTPLAPLPPFPHLQVLQLNSLPSMPLPLFLRLAPLPSLTDLIIENAEESVTVDSLTLDRATIADAVTAANVTMESVTTGGATAAAPLLTLRLCNIHANSSLLASLHLIPTLHTLVLPPLSWLTTIPPSLSLSPSLSLIRFIDWSNLTGLPEEVAKAPSVLKEIEIRGEHSVGYLSSKLQDLVSFRESRCLV